MNLRPCPDVITVRRHYVSVSPAIGGRASSVPRTEDPQGRPGRVQGGGGGAGRIRSVGAIRMECGRCYRIGRWATR